MERVKPVGDAHVADHPRAVDVRLLVKELWLTSIVMGRAHHSLRRQTAQVSRCCPITASDMLSVSPLLTCTDFRACVNTVATLWPTKSRSRMQRTVMTALAVITDSGEELEQMSGSPRYQGRELLGARLGPFLVPVLTGR